MESSAKKKKSHSHSLDWKHSTGFLQPLLVAWGGTISDVETMLYHTLLYGVSIFASRRYSLSASLVPLDAVRQATRSEILF